MTARCLTPCACIALFAVLLIPSDATAKLVLITRGDTIKPVGDLPPETRQPGGPSKVGFKYSYFGVFWLDLWTWGGEFCVFEDKRFAPIAPGQAALLLNRGDTDLSTPFLYRFPLGLIILVIVGGLFILASIFGGNSAEPPALFQDQRYIQALEVVSAKSKPPEGQVASSSEADQERWNAAFEEGVQHLVQQGIPREEASKNLTAMLDALASAPQPGPKEPS